ncbi:oxidoreductase (D-threo-aldose 1-dehydrogenase) [Roseobacter sp. SK209-2-6]|uniref:aldo/keto reductase n=1 Tax=Roseobacter sp. SK209-2-6 TaxID=388739 RepID=UPI0000F3C51C|nr:aldo/keto reductase [Roseobacter sp. SK209-2-6]EBA18448.1 oxidoreductase (D-threo-aldose 1-dehydrogenase) [Roseobacter sp. SK209-2-6]
MKTNRIGNTDVIVTEVSFGCASIGNLYHAVSDAQAYDVIETAWRAGIRYFDTAPHYGRGLSEQRLGQVLKTKPRDSFTLSTKVGRLLSPGQAMPEADGFIDPLPNAVRYDYSGDGIEASLETSLQRLGTTKIDIAFVHDIGRYTHGSDNDAHLEAFLGSGYERLVRLKEQGRIHAFGLGVNENEVCLEVMQHGPLDVILLAGRLTLLDRSAEELLTQRCRAQGTSLILGGVLNSGILATGPVAGATYDYAPASPEILAQVAELQTTAEVLGLPLATAALLFAKQHELAASVLIGTAKATTLRRNLSAMRTELPRGFSSAFKV